MFAHASRIRTEFAVICAAAAGALVVMLANFLSESATGHFFTNPPHMLVNGAAAAIFVTSLTAFVCWLSEVTTVRGRAVNGVVAALVLYATNVIATGAAPALLPLALAALFGAFCGTVYHAGRRFAQRSY